MSEPSGCAGLDDLIKTATDVDDYVVTYEITVGNTAPNATTAPIVVSDPLPAGLKFVAVSGTGWSCTEGQVVTCSYGQTWLWDSRPRSS